MAHRGKKTALVAAFAVVATVAGGAYALRDRLMTEWWLHRLRSPVEATRLAAAARLKLVPGDALAARVLAESHPEALKLPLHGVAVPKALPRSPEAEE